jgi:hypothetical protein
VAQDFKTFEEWEKGAQATYTCEGGISNRWQRDVFDMLGYVVFLETFFPWSPFEEIGTSMIVESFNVTQFSPEMKMAETFGGKWEQGYYAEVGHGWPRFWRDDCAEKCWNFLTAHLQARKARCKPRAVSAVLSP